MTGNKLKVENMDVSPVSEIGALSAFGGAVFEQPLRHPFFTNLPAVMLSPQEEHS